VRTRARKDSDAACFPPPLTTGANAIVAPIHAKAIPVILTMLAEVDHWLEADIGDALILQRLPDDPLRIVASGEKEDGVAA